MKLILCTLCVLSFVKYHCAWFWWFKPTNSRGQMFHPPERDVSVENWHYKFNTSLGQGYHNQVIRPPPGVHNDRTPDYRIPETLHMAKYNYMEYHRPFQVFRNYWEEWVDWYSAKAMSALRRQLGCYCTVVMRLVQLVAGCAMLTHRHSLTTAAPIDEFLKEHGWRPHFTQMLGVQYDRDVNGNATKYVEISRIHFHPGYTPFKQNISHALPVNDLAVLTLLHPIKSMVGDMVTRSFLCNRVPHPVINMRKVFHFWIVGFQFIRSYNRNPNPWSKYALRTRDIMERCPKRYHWGWHYCVRDRTGWAPLGLDSGAALHQRMMWWRVEYAQDGLMGLGSFSTDLREQTLIHYFTAINHIEVIEFLYDAYMGLLPYKWLDKRFYDTAMRAPVPKPWYEVPWAGVHTYCAFYYDVWLARWKCIGGRLHPGWIEGDMQGR